MNFFRRETFDFDRVLYRDKFVQVTLSMVVVCGGMLARHKTIDVESICGVWQPADIKIMRPSNTQWWRGKAFRKLALHCIPLKRQPDNLVISLRDKSRIFLDVERPHELAFAITKAQMTRYYR